LRGRDVGRVETGMIMRFLKWLRVPWRELSRLRPKHRRIVYVLSLLPSLVGASLLRAAIDPSQLGPVGSALFGACLGTGAVVLWSASMKVLVRKFAGGASHGPD
jgi:hypothetical protein